MNLKKHVYRGIFYLRYHNLLVKKFVMATLDGRGGQRHIQGEPYGWKIPIGKEYWRQNIWKKQTSLQHRVMRR